MRFWDLELTDENYKDLQNWVTKEKMVGLVDENMGGIIGYINRSQVKEILKLLNEVKS